MFWPYYNVQSLWPWGSVKRHPPFPNLRALHKLLASSGKIKIVPMTNISQNSN